MRLLRLPSLNDFKGLKPTLWGIPQPGPDDHWEPYEDSGPLDLVIMPGVAFTTGGARLGHGMGYYDRMLANHKTKFGKLPARYALALTQQIVDNVPLGSTDVPLDGVIRAD
ncbi:5-formyltetrahydrofolate cyclo-ligase [Ancylostoma duodenale]|uniref:5-formyltetrahydrofolate cyclo-ligase n=1 Tax=Ancylostoma duodenale TaxID=51022 RepID=A0A0C2GCK5_9BILA|nr:5-formyltetrahydrofolate cyclo-ligase [Ancylostoma duodenale]